MKYLALIFSLFTSMCAAQTGVGRPTQVHVFPHEGIFVFYVTLTEGSIPSCAGTEFRWAIRTSEPGAKELISMVNAAVIAERNLVVVGNGNCDSTGFGMYVNHLYLQ